MSKPYHEPRAAWTSCIYCAQTEFSTLKLFVRHLREKHCKKEGGSFVCLYGENNVCCTLPVEGVSDTDYERHVYKHHAFSMPFSSGNLRKISSGSQADSQGSLESKWTVYSAAQNLPAVLNDPSKGKQRDFFTKTWGDSFVELTEVPDAPYLPHITIHHFEHYLKKIAKRHKRHLRLNALTPKPHTHADLLQTFPHLRIGKQAEKNHFDISVIPKIFLHPGFDLSKKDTFDAVYSQTLPGSNNNNTTKTCFEPTASNSAKLLQEKLTHYLDLVEVQIAQQVAQKSDAFFHAMTSHDVLMEQLGQTISVVKTLREKIHKIDKDLVRDSLDIIKCERNRSNYIQVYRKLKVMSTVMQTQPTIQVLLSSPDYVGALDLIHTTQDLLSQDLAGIHSFRHLSSELAEMLKVIDTLMSEEFERHSTADLNRPLIEGEPEVLEGEKLSCIVMGMLRRGNMVFVDTYRKESIAAVKAAVKQAAIEVVARSDISTQTSGGGDLSLEDQLKALPVEEWSLLLSNATTALLRLLERVKKGHDIMLKAVNTSAGKRETDSIGDDLIVSDSGDWQLSNEDHEKVSQKIHSLLVYICEYSQDRCAQLLSSRSLMWPEEKKKEDGKLNSSHWLAERANLAQLRELSSHVEFMTKGCERICPGFSTHSLKPAFNIQAKTFISRFHHERLTKLSLILDTEPWKQADVPARFQDLVYQIAEKGKFSVTKEDLDSFKTSSKTKYLFINDEKFAVIGTVLILVNIVAEYCVHAEDISLSAESLLRYLHELLTKFNLRCYKLMLGGEAVSEKTGLTKITSTNLALLLRSLQLILWLLPHVKLHFKELIGDDPRNYLGEVSQKIKDHARDVNAKLLEIMNKLIVAELMHWEAKPPAPSKPFQNICKHLIKFNEAIANILPLEKIQELYQDVNSKFKESFSDKLHKMNIVNNGGPQHGLVITELTFYLEDLKKVTSLPPESLELATMNDIWDSKSN